MSIASPEYQRKQREAVLADLLGELPPKPEPMTPEQIAQLREINGLLQSGVYTQADIETFLPEDAKLLQLANEKGTQWTARLMGMAKDFIREDDARHSDMPKQVQAARAAAIAEAINTRTADFTNPVSGDWDLRKAIAETEKITSTVCAQYGWTPRETNEDYLAMRTKFNPARPSSILERAERGKR